MSAASLKQAMLAHVKAARNSHHIGGFIIGDAIGHKLTKEQACDLFHLFVNSFSTGNHDSIIPDGTVSQAKFDELHQAWDNQRLSIAAYQEQMQGFTEQVAHLQAAVTELGDKRWDAIKSLVAAFFKQKDAVKEIESLKAQLAEQQEANLKMANECAETRLQRDAAWTACDKLKLRLRDICNLTRGY